MPGKQRRLGLVYGRLCFAFGQFVNIVTRNFWILGTNIFHLKVIKPSGFLILEWTLQCVVVRGCLYLELQYLDS